MARLKKEDWEKKEIGDRGVFTWIRSAALEHHWVGGNPNGLSPEQEVICIDQLLTNPYTRLPTKRLPSDYLEEQMSLYQATARFLSDEGKGYLVSEMQRKYKLDLRLE